MAIWFDGETGETHQGEFTECCDRCGRNDATFYVRSADGELLCSQCEGNKNDEL